MEIGELAGMKKADVEKVKAFLSILADGEFLSRLDEMGGYSCPKTGTVIRI